MSDPAQDRLDLLRQFGIDRMAHNSQAELIKHLQGTATLLKNWGARPELCDAALFHSIYGTEYFTTQAVNLSSRDRVIEVIGEEAEALVWLWCFGRRLSLPSEAEAVPRMQDRRNETWIELAPGQLQDLVNLWIADTLEQLRRMPEREVPSLPILHKYRHLALPPAVQALEEMMAEFPASS
ncbi:MAG: DUF6817 domain-containing protein [Planctomycetota bacterium]|jgi:hypothetical protein